MPPQARLDQQRILVRELRARLAQRRAPVRVFETHISWVLVAGPFAWKIKKALAPGFLDFTTLASRRFHCLEELRLNRRLAPDLYLEVVPITGSAHEPLLCGAGDPIEYAVKMRAFEQSALWSARLSEGLLSAEEIDALAQLLASFHGRAAAAPAGAEWGNPEVQRAIAEENFAGIAALLQPQDAATLGRLRDWEAAERRHLDGIFRERKRRGMVRECHGDLHAANILTQDGRVQAFDCIEFNARMRWIDVLNDVAFACMDLAFRGRPDYAARLLNRYLAESGDYAGLAVWRYYLVQRALVRCKVALLRARQGEQADAGAGADQEAHRYLMLAWRSTRPAAPAIVIMHGLAGCGKSTFAARLAEATGAVCLRSDVERKRMHGLNAAARGSAALYAEQATRAVYLRLSECARQIVAAGYPAIVDAAFLQPAQRAAMRRLAAQLRARFVIVDLHADERVLRERVAARARQGRDASDADLGVLERQLAAYVRLTAEEATEAVSVDAESWDAGLARIGSLIGEGADDER